MLNTVIPRVHLKIVICIKFLITNELVIKQKLPTYLMEICVRGSEDHFFFNSFSKKCFSLVDISEIVWPHLAATSMNALIHSCLECPKRH